MPGGNRWLLERFLELQKQFWAVSEELHKFTGSRDT